MGKFVWYLYFSIYWSTYDWGEKKHPEDNAINLIRWILLINLSAIYQVFIYFGYPFSVISIICICGIPAFVIPYLLIQNNKKGFNLRFEKFEFLKEKEYNRKRLTIVIAVLSFSIVLNAAVAIFRNIMKG